MVSLPRRFDRRGAMAARISPDLLLEKPARAGAPARDMPAAPTSGFDFGISRASEAGAISRARARFPPRRYGIERFHGAMKMMPFSPIMRGRYHQVSRFLRLNSPSQRLRTLAADDFTSFIFYGHRAHGRRHAKRPCARFCEWPRCRRYAFLVMMPIPRLAGFEMTSCGHCHAKRSLFRRCFCQDSAIRGKGRKYTYIQLLADFLTPPTSAWLTPPPRFLTARRRYAAPYDMPLLLGL